MSMGGRYVESAWSKRLIGGCTDVVGDWLVGFIVHLKLDWIYCLSLKCLFELDQNRHPPRLLKAVSQWESLAQQAGIRKEERKRNNLLCY